jgi:hypothetical protein
LVLGGERFRHQAAREEEAKVRVFNGEKMSNVASARKHEANMIEAMNPQKFHGHAAAQRKSSARTSASEPIISP